ncbi:heavy metal translocating P-type ATPase [Nitrospina watsonii]|uniref:Lead, cadmium, zinc and mercury transporting ATPase n=1 Tax=Nitrospina watsonii TaxID=1323948 RepID=A0ABM9HGZ7_9BACT|nr:heavy metal translocating P-type ATPase [Nitrospina watsonii]CAI2719612.1 Lead, cadmium, zinc and mercury transporting ATPase [Nitrospina watsonii]
MATETVQIKVSGMMCSFCTMSIERALKHYDGIKSVMVNLVHGIVLVEADTSKMNRDDLAQAVEKLGYTVSGTQGQQAATDEGIHKLIKQRGIIGMILAVIVLAVDPLNLFGLPAQIRAGFSFAVAAVVLLWVGYPILRKTVLVLTQRVINANVLLSAGAWGSFVIGTLSLFDPRWPNFLPVATWLMALHLFFGYFKLDTRKKASEAVSKLLALQPRRTRVLRGGEPVEVPTEEIAIGEVVMVRPGERIPLDGEVIEGTASVDESSFTGESVPPIRKQGDPVLGGTLNLDGSLQIRTTKVGQDSFLNQIVSLMTRIAERKPSIELLADWLMNYYGPVVFIVAILAFAGWGLATGDYLQATVVLVTTLIMGYPCALGISTPMLAAIAGGRGMAIGLLVKASEVFQELSTVDTVVFDKTGTLTYGRPTVTDIVPFGASREQVLQWAEAVERQSEHPVGLSIGFYAQKEGVGKLDVDGFRATPGKGVSGNVDGGRVLAGRPAFLEENGVRLTEDMRARIDALASEGKTVVTVARGETTVGAIGLQDVPRRGAERVMEKLRRRGIKTVMLTGDIRNVAEAIGKQLGIDEVHAELLPTDKVSAIETLQSEGRKVAMVGDGINDAPALAQANAGIAIGAGTDVAIESAGVILIGDRLDDVVSALILGKASYRTLTANVVVAVLFNIVGMVLAAMGLVTPELAIMVMILSIFAILLNTLRIRFLNLQRDEAGTETVSAEVEFQVPNMVCEGCASKISTALELLPGVLEIQPNVEQKRVAIRYEPAKVQEQQLMNVLGKNGFTCTMGSAQ